MTGGFAAPSWDDVEFNTEIEYVGPDELPGEYVAPDDFHAPYRFRFESVGGCVKALTKFNAPRYWDDDHPASNPQYWEVAD